jgi:DNA-binding NtrC family response regulator
MKLGAFDYLVKPVEEPRLASAVKRALAFREMRNEYAAFKEKVLSNTLENPGAFVNVVTNNAKMHALFRYVEAIAPSRRAVLITGETGVGKELIARAVHELSKRKGELVAISVAALDDNLFSDTLFGHVKGAFSGADKPRRGLVEKAAGGTLFLDEIGDLEMSSQVKLLRLLQENEYYPLGADAARPADARVIVATNRRLDERQAAGKFRSDLYFRLQTHRAEVPPLRERADDIPLLLDHFLEKASCELSKRLPTAPRELVSLLTSYHFPGNVRELEAMVYDAVSHHHTKVLSMETFRAHIKHHRRADYPEVKPTGAVGPVDSAHPFSHLKELPTLGEVQVMLIEEALRRAGHNQTTAAEMLGITRSGLSKAIKRKNIGTPKAR